MKRKAAIMLALLLATNLIFFACYTTGQQEKARRQAYAEEIANAWTTGDADTLSRAYLKSGDPFFTAGALGDALTDGRRSEAAMSAIIIAQNKKMIEQNEQIIALLKGKKP